MFYSKKLVNVVHLSGIIGSKGRRILSLSNIKPLLDKAFKPKDAKAVALIINSPGGAAAQSEIIANYIKEQAKETKIPVIAFVEDVAASGGYFIASAATEIYALAKTSIVGSIGVLYSGFGFQELIKNYGIERRVYSAGKNKVTLDSFQKEKAEDVAIINSLLQETHEHFKNFVKESRGNKLELADEELFSGKFWLASTGVKIGLIDGIVPSYQSFLKEKFGKKVKINFIKAKKSFLGSFLNAKIDLSENLIDDVISQFKENITVSTLEYKK